MNFKPTLWKVIGTIIIGILILSLLIIIFFIDRGVHTQGCAVGIEDSCEDVFSFRLFPEGNCGGCAKATTFKDLAGDISIFLLPFIFIYLLWSLFENKKKRKKNDIKKND